MKAPNMLVSSEDLLEILTAINVSTLPHGTTEKAVALITQCEAHTNHQLYLTRYEDGEDGSLILVTAPAGTDAEDVEGLLQSADPEFYQFERHDRWADTWPIEQVSAVRVGCAEAAAGAQS